MEFFLLILGLAGLWLGAEIAIAGALDIARHYKISQMFVGLTILAFGTDLPELFINITAAFQRLAGTETSDLVVGQTIGTSLSQIGLMLGICGLVGTVAITKREWWRDGWVMVASIILLALLGLDGNLSKIDGLILMFSYLLYFLTICREEKIRSKFRLTPKLHPTWAALSIATGFATIIYGSHLTVTNAVLISQQWGIAQSLIGILIVGLGTSLPELVTSLAAMRRGAGAMATGNLMGSNIFDILFTLGIGSAISGFAFNRSLLTIDLPILLFLSLLVLFLFKTHLGLLTRRRIFFKETMRLERKEAYVLITVYVLYFVTKATGIFAG